MNYSASNVIDTVVKRLVYNKTKTDGGSGIVMSANEQYNYTSIVRPGEIWTDSVSTASSQFTTVTMTDIYSNVAVLTKGSWKLPNVNCPLVPPSYGLTYTPRFQWGSSYTDINIDLYPYVIDYVSGTLNFIGNLPPFGASDVLYCSGYTYTGSYGSCDAGQLTKGTIANTIMNTSLSSLTSTTLGGVVTVSSNFVTNSDIFNIVKTSNIPCSTAHITYTTNSNVNGVQLMKIIKILPNLLISGYGRGTICIKGCLCITDDTVGGAENTYFDSKIHLDWSSNIKRLIDFQINRNNFNNALASRSNLDLFYGSNNSNYACDIIVALDASSNINVYMKHLNNASNTTFVTLDIAYSGIYTTALSNYITYPKVLYTTTSNYYTTTNSNLLTVTDSTTFATVQSASNSFNITGDANTRLGIVYSGGKTGINNNNPIYTLDVGGNINFSGLLFQNGSQFSSSPWTGTPTTGVVTYS